MRLCKISGNKAVFHRWENVTEYIQNQLEHGGQPGRTIRHIVAIVEYEDGSVASVSERDVVFMDSKRLFAKLERRLESWSTKNNDMEDI